MRLRDLAAAIALACAGCRAADPAPPDSIRPTEAPARIVAPTAESRAALKAAVGIALNGVDVTLADDALMHSSVLVVGPKLVRDAQNNPIMGRDLGRPIQFELRRIGEACVLELRATGERWTLSHTQCVAE